MVNTPSSVAIAGSGDLMTRLAAHYRALGAKVSEVAFGTNTDPEQTAAAIVDPVDLLIVADAFEAAAHGVSELTRTELATASHRLTYLPFRLAAVLKPRLASTGGRAVLITNADARMIADNSKSPYLDRPFRSAAHALWRCLSVEWKPDGISCGIVGLATWGESASAVAGAATGSDGDAFPVELTDTEGQVLGW